MNFLTLSSIILAITIGAIWTVLANASNVSAANVSLSDQTGSQSDIQDSVVLDDLPPPDDTYTPDQRRYS